MDKKPPAMFATAGNFLGMLTGGAVDWTAPTHVVIDAECANAGTGAKDGNRNEGITVYSNHTATPETNVLSLFLAPCA